eukprot:599168-Rhodomonas_salina.1
MGCIGLTYRECIRCEIRYDQLHWCLISQCRGVHTGAPGCAYAAAIPYGTLYCHYYYCQRGAVWTYQYPPSAIHPVHRHKMDKTLHQPWQ